MGGLSIWHWLVVLVVVLLLFGKGKISSLMGDLAQGVKAFKKGMADDEVPAAKTETPKALSSDGKETVSEPEKDRAAKL